MALEGTLDTFDLADVVALICGTNKSGDLSVNGEHATGHLHFVAGNVTTSTSDRTAPADSAANVLFELLRNVSGSYSFQTGDPDDSAEAGVPGEQVLADAQTLMAEWVDLSAVVPGETAPVALADAIDPSGVLITPAMWATVRAVAISENVRDVARVERLGEFEACRRVRDVVDAGLVEIREASLPIDEPTDFAQTGPEPATQAGHSAPPAKSGAPTTDDAPVLDAVIVEDAPTRRDARPDTSGMLTRFLSDPSS